MYQRSKCRQQDRGRDDGPEEMKMGEGREKKRKMGRIEGRERREKEKKREKREDGWNGNNGGREEDG